MLYRYPTTHLQKAKFWLMGHDFIGAAIRFAHFKKILKKIPFFKDVLDAGSGTGDFSFYLAEKYPSCSISAYDINKKTFEQNIIAQKHMNISNIIFSENNLLHLQEKEKYDLIISICTLIYFSKDKTKDVLMRLTHALRKGGYLYLDLPQQNFLEINYTPIKYYPKHFQALQDENSGDLYSFEEIKNMLTALGYDLIHTNKSFSYPGKFAWEMDNILKEKNFLRLRWFLLPLFKIFAWLDATTKHKKGSCFVVLARKRAS